MDLNPPNVREYALNFNGVVPVLKKKLWYHWLSDEFLNLFSLCTNQFLVPLIETYSHQVSIFETFEFPPVYHAYPQPTIYDAHTIVWTCFFVWAAYSHRRPFPRYRAANRQFTELVTLAALLTCNYPIHSLYCILGYCTQALCFVEYLIGLLVSSNKRRIL